MGSDADLMVDTFLESFRKMNGREPTPTQIADLRTEVAAIMATRRRAALGVGALIGFLVGVVLLSVAVVSYLGYAVAHE